MNPISRAGFWAVVLMLLAVVAIGVEVVQGRRRAAIRDIYARQSAEIARQTEALKAQAAGLDEFSGRAAAEHAEFRRAIEECRVNRKILFGEVRELARRLDELETGRAEPARRVDAIEKEPGP